MRRALVLAVTLVAHGAHAHVAPSADDNNRYLKLTPEGDRVRLAYTVFFGEVPGAQTRPGIDTDHDGSISEAEQTAFATKVGADVAAGLEISVDGASAPVTWDVVTAGMGSQSVRAGAFSIDLVGYLCLKPGDHHSVLLRDRFRIARPGETELRIEDAFGIKITGAHVGTANDASHDYKFVGPGGPLSDDGLELTFDVSERAMKSGACGKLEQPHGLPMVFVVVAAASVGFVLALAVTLITRRRRA